MFFVFLYPRIDIIIGNTILFSCYFIRQFVSQTFFDGLYFFIMCYVSIFHCIHFVFLFFCFYSFSFVFFLIHLCIFFFSLFFYFPIYFLYIYSLFFILYP